MAANIHLLIGAEDRLVKFEMQVFGEVSTALGAAAATSALAEHVAKTENVAEDVAEILEDSGIESGRTSAAAAPASVPEAVIQRSLLAIREDCVRFRDLLKLILRLRIVRIAVRMPRHRELAISALDFNLGGPAGDTKHFLKIPFCVRRQNLPPLLSTSI